MTFDGDCYQSPLFVYYKYDKVFLFTIILYNFASMRDNIIGYIVLLAMLLVGYFGYRAKIYQDKYRQMKVNVEAYQYRNSELEQKNLQYQMSMNELKASKDSVDKKIVELVDSLKIKGKNITQVQYNYSVIQKTDTISFKDTVFVENLAVDTVFGDKWYTMSLSLRYPDSISVSPSFTSERYTVIHRSKVYERTPSKIFFIRWFQKKHWVTEVTVTDKNPYIQNNEYKVIKID